MYSSAWDAITGLTAYQVVRVPRLSATAQTSLTDRDAYRQQRVAALVSAYHAAAGPVVLSWQRHSAAGPIEVHVAGAGIAHTESVGEMAALSVPAGGAGRAVAAGTVASGLARRPYWTAITAITDGLLLDDPPTGENLLRPSLEEILLGVWQGPFAWCVVAEPVSGGELDELIAQVSDQQRQAGAKSGSSPDYAVREQRLSHRHGELSQAATTGLWRVHFAAGGQQSRDAARVAALVCASADLTGLPYRFSPSGTVDAIDTVLGTPVTARGGHAPFHASTALLAAIAKPPVVEIPGVRFQLQSDFDVTPETSDGGADGEQSVRLGTVLDRNRLPAGTLALPYASVNRHTFVCGATGSGKSQTIRGLLETAALQGLPWLVVEPAKAEYRLMATRLAAAGIEVAVIRLGEVDTPPAGINPLEPGRDAQGRRYPLQTHLDLVRALFMAAFEADEPFPQVLAAALTRCYEQLGWDLALGEPRAPGVEPRYPTLTDLQHAAEQVVTEIGYGQEIADNVRGFIRVRLSSLRLGTTGRFLEGGHPLDVDRLLAGHVVVEIEDVGDDRDKAFLMGTVLIRLTEHLRLEQRRHSGPSRPSRPLRHVTVFEEAHRLLRATSEAGPAAHAVEMFAGLLAEIRAYGEGLIIAEQIPSKLLPDVIKNTAVKIVHRLPARDDRDAVGATMNITDAQSELVVTLPPGQAAVFTDGMDYPVLTQMADGTGRESESYTAPATAAGLITPRSATCGGACRDTPCTLRDIRAAQEILRTEPRLVLWAELTVLAHLTGWTSPIPGPPLLAVFRALPEHDRDCALSHAVDHAVAARSSAIGHTISPHELASHVVETLRVLVLTGNTHKGEEPQWLAPSYRWCLVRDALADADRGDLSAAAHPRTSEWEEVYGKSIPGDTSRAQLDSVQRWLNADQRDSVALRVINYGTYERSATEIALGTSREADDWDSRLAAHLEEYRNCGWPVRYLAKIDETSLNSSPHEAMSSDVHKGGRSR
jgi:DNA helicase HerA-like ATPase